MHSGAPASITLHPAPADAGLKFLVTKKGRVVAEIAATYKAVKNLTLCTVIGDERGVTVSTVEHLLSALRGLSVDNCYIEIDSREVPIMDGSAAPFVAAIDEVGLRELSAPRKFIKVLKSVSVTEGDAFGEIAPHSSFHLDVEIDFMQAVFGGDEKVKISHLETCGTCSGDGMKPGTKPRTCGTCSGSGVVTQVARTPLGMLQQQSACPQCQGSGQIIDEFCGGCSGRASARSPATRAARLA